MLSRGVSAAARVPGGAPLSLAWRRFGAAATTSSERLKLILEHTSLVEEYGMKLRLITEDNPIYHTQDEESLPFESPFWGFLWPGGMALTRYITENPHVICRKRVLDLGSGCGSGSIASLRAGASSVVANDICPFAHDALLLNMKLNGIPSDAIVFHSENKFGNSKDYFEQYDIILCGDMLYNSELSEQVTGALGKHGMVLVGDPERTFCQENATLLQDEIASYDYGQDGFPCLKVFRLNLENLHVGNE